MGESRARKRWSPCLLALGECGKHDDGMHVCVRCPHGWMCLSSCVKGTRPEEYPHGWICPPTGVRKVKLLKRDGLPTLHGRRCLAVLSEPADCRVKGGLLRRGRFPVPQDCEAYERLAGVFPLVQTTRGARVCLGTLSCSALWEVGTKRSVERCTLALSLEWEQ